MDNQEVLNNSEVPQMSEFYERIGFEGKLEDISRAACRDFSLGELASNKLVTDGYEDFNFALTTDRGKYFVKVMANFRTDKECQRYADVMQRAKAAGVRTPELIESGRGVLDTTEVGGTKLRMAAMEFVDGDTYYSLKQLPDEKELREIAHQAALINSIDIHPEPVYDHWAIVNFPKEFAEKGSYLTSDDHQKLEPLSKVFEKLHIDQLPHAFVHGDLITTNVMKNHKGDLWVLDFAVSGYHPRIQELAVLACNLAFDANSKEQSNKNLGILLDEYQKTIPLTPQELAALPGYIELAHAMHVLQANYEKVANNNQSKENEYWLAQGRAGLNQI